MDDATKVMSMPRTVSLHASDWAAIALYMLATAAIAVLPKLMRRVRGARPQGEEDYFLAGRDQHWLIIAITLFATFFSSISFVAIPGEAFTYGLTYSLGLFVVPIVAPLAIWLFLRFFFQSETYTSYEYLERRFNAPMRVAGGVLFTVSKLIYGGVVYYAAATLFESLVGWPAWVTIVGIGAFTVLYTAHGGMKAVIATDVMQAGVLVLGVGAVLYKLLAAAGFDVSGIWHFAGANGHAYGDLTSPRFWQIDLKDRYNAWLILYGVVIAQLNGLSADQLSVQRLLTTKGYDGARRAVLVNAVQSIPLVGMFWAVGLGLFYFYRHLHPERLPAGLKPDHVVGHFIASELPSPVPGLILVALLAALMSTASSVVNSVATVIYRDGLVRMGWAHLGGPREGLTCKLISALAGVVLIGVALLLTFGGQGVKSSVFEVNAVWGGVGGVLLAPFLLGVLAPFVGGGPTLVGAAVGALCSLVLPWFLYYSVEPAERISFVWLAVPGFAIALFLPVVLSFAWPQRKDVTGLTLWTLRPRGERPRNDVARPEVVDVV